MPVLACSPHLWSEKVSTPGSSLSWAQEEAAQPLAPNRQHSVDSWALRAPLLGPHCWDSKFKLRVEI